MTYEAEQQVVKALRSMPWYMFLVPALFTLFMLLFNPSVLTDMRPEYTWWDFMWIVARVGLFVWILRQLLRYAVFGWMIKFRTVLKSYSQATQTISSSNQSVRPPFTNVTIISRRTIPHHERRPMWR
jgi:hypothetical protein